MNGISVIIHTASSDNFLSGQGIPSYFSALVENLRWQTITDFELVHVDTFFEHNQEDFAKIAAPFTIKHVPVHPSHRYWYDRNATYIAAAKNTGILYADGELCISFDDSEFFPDDLLERYWNHYRAGKCMNALHHRMSKVATECGLLTRPIQGDTYTNDHRWRVVKGLPFPHIAGGYTYAGTSFPLEAALTVNGVNERMDGSKGLEDVDFGNRLTKAGVRFVMDPQGYLYIVDHPSYMDGQSGWEKEPGYDQDTQRTALPKHPTSKRIEHFIAIENHGIYRSGGMVANKGEVTEHQIEVIRADSMQYPTPKFDPMSNDPCQLGSWTGTRRGAFEIWRKTPTFDLREQRAELRASADWRW